MAGITGQGTTFNLPNFVGELFGQTPQDTKVLSATGGLTGGKSANSVLHQWSTYDLRSADQRTKVEGADAPTREERVRANITNVVQIHHEAVEISYTKQGAFGQFNSTGSAHPGAVGIAGTNAVTSELSWQQAQMLKQIARDVEWSFINGVFDNPSTNGSPRKTRGLFQAAGNRSNVGTAGTGAATYTANASTDVLSLTAGHGYAVNDQIQFVQGSGVLPGGIVEGFTYYIKTVSTNDVTLSLTPGGPTLDITSTGTGHATRIYYTPKILVKADLIGFMQTVWENGGLSEEETATLIVNGGVKRKLTEIFISDSVYRQDSRTVGGVTVDTIMTDFGTLNVMLNRHAPTGAVIVASLEQVAPVFLPIPGKGHFFIEPLAKTGAKDQAQFYGEIGLEYGNPLTHGVLFGLAAGPDLTP